MTDKYIIYYLFSNVSNINANIANFMDYVENPIMVSKDSRLTTRQI